MKGEEWRLEDGGWGLGEGWRMEGRGWRMEVGRRMEDRGWRLEDRGWSVKNRGWRMGDRGWKLLAVWSNHWHCSLVPLASPRACAASHSIARICPCLLRSPINFFCETLYIAKHSQKGIVRVAVLSSRTDVLLHSWSIPCALCKLSPLLSLGQANPERDPGFPLHIAGG